MNKHRVIGLVVLLAMAVLLGQFCLNYYKGSRHHLQAYRSPPITPLSEQMTTADHSPHLQTVEKLMEEHVDTALETAAPVSAWMVQVAILSNEASAQSLMKQLKSLGFDAFISSLLLQNKPVYRVAAGPFTRQPAAVDALSSIQQALKITGILKQYTINAEPSTETE